MTIKHTTSFFQNNFVTILMVFLCSVTNSPNKVIDYCKQDAQDPFGGRMRRISVKTLDIYIH